MKMRRFIRGFTLWELLVSVLVAGILLGVGVPSFIDFRRNNAMASAANDYVSAILAARAEAVKRQVPVTLCMSPDPLDPTPSCGAGSNGGFIVFVDENGNFDAVTNAPDLTDATDGNAAIDTDEAILIRREEPADAGDIEVDSDSLFIAYGPNGFRRDIATGPSATWILLCDAQRGNVTVGGISASRAIRIEPTGRGQVVRTVAEVDLALTALGRACP